MPDLTALPVGPLTVSGVLMFIIWCLITDRFVTRGRYLERVAECDRLREANDRLMAQNTQLIAGGQLSVNAMQAISDRAAAQSEGAAP